MIPQETVELIKDTAQIVDVISDFVTLKRRGGNFVACCPFHNEKTPSFNVSPSRGIYKCFGCGKSGTAIGFIMEYEHLSYVEALRYLANKYHIEVKEEEETAEQIAARQRNESLLLVSDFAGKFFVDQLATPEGRSIGYQYSRTKPSPSTGSAGHPAAGKPSRRPPRPPATRTNTCSRPASARSTTAVTAPSTTVSTTASSSRSTPSAAASSLSAGARS